MTHILDKLRLDKFCSFALLNCWKILVYFENIVLTFYTVHKQTLGEGRAVNQGVYVLLGCFLPVAERNVSMNYK
jgi:hypothetical protein